MCYCLGVKARSLKSGRRTVWLLAILFVVLSGCRRASEPIPEQLLGTWHTTAKSHVGSVMEVSKQLIVFSRDSDMRMSGRIVEFRTLQDQLEKHYRISYQDDDRNEYHLELRYDPKNGGTLTFKNQPALIWTRKGARL